MSDELDRLFSQHHPPPRKRKRKTDTAGHGKPNGAAAREAERLRAKAIGDGIPVPLPTIMRLDEMRERLVFIEDGAQVAVRAQPSHPLNVADFKLAMCASRTAIAGMSKSMRTVDLWLNDDRRKTVRTLTFRPGQPETTTDPEGAIALNLWRAPVRAASQASADPFLQHVAYLVPNAAECERFLDWLAHTEQCPGVLPHTHYLMVTPQTGVGRNWLGSLLARVWPGQCCLGFDLVGTLNTGFNGSLSRRVLVVVDELKAADSGYSAANHAQQLKALLTTEHRLINPKYGRQRIEFNCARFLMFSQHYDALPLENADRRVIVIANPTQRKAPGYYASLYALLDVPDFVAGVANWLAARDLSRFNPHEPAPLSDAKQAAINAGRSDAAQALIALREGTTVELMFARDIANHLRDCGIPAPTGRGLSHAYAEAGLVPCKAQPMINQRRERIVALRNSERWARADVSALRAAFGEDDLHS